MLVLTRKAGETIVIDNRITLTVQDIVDDIGIIVTADADCTVLANGGSEYSCKAGQRLPLSLGFAIKFPPSAIIHVSSLRREGVRLACEAPREISFMRGELLKTAQS